MPRQVADRSVRRRLFIRALAQGSPVAEAGRHSRLGRSTLYEWRAVDAAFREAWDSAAEAGAALLAARRDDTIRRKAVDGVAVPVVRKGRIVGERIRYSDRALMFGIRDLLLREALARETEAEPVHQ